MISLDDYFVNRLDTPRDEFGEYDYESLYALDLEQFNADLNALLRGEEVSLPTYDFEHGQRVYKGNVMKLEKDDILLIEGIHGLNPDLSTQIPEFQKFKVYISALTTLSIDDHNWVPTSDNRLLRRIIRDHKYRGVSAQETIARWQSVRRGEEKWIFPFQENADAMFNSSLIFELGERLCRAATQASAARHARICRGIALAAIHLLFRANQRATDTAHESPARVPWWQQFPLLNKKRERAPVFCYFNITFLLFRMYIPGVDGSEISIPCRLCHTAGVSASSTTRSIPDERLSPAFTVASNIV